METEWVCALDLDLVRQPSKASVAFVPPMSIKDRLLLWMVVRSQTYYPEHILADGAGKLVALLSWVPALSALTDWRRGWWRSKHHTESGTQVWGLGVQVWTGT